jgi:hypothetical protein
MTDFSAAKFARAAVTAALAWNMPAAAVIGAFAVTQTAFAQDAQASITAQQAATIQSNLTNAIAAINSSGLQGQALTAALQQAISQAVVVAVNTLGPQASASITSAVLATPAIASFPGALVGQALGRAAATVAANFGTAAAAAVATTVANEGPAGSQTSFSAAETAAGGPASVAAAATAGPSASASNSSGTGAGSSTSQAGSTGTGSGGSGGGSSGCSNPSCT